jgi:hypothetical protein
MKRVLFLGLVPSLCLAGCTDYGVNLIPDPDPVPQDTLRVVDSELAESLPPSDTDPPVCGEGPWPGGEASLDEACIWPPEQGSFTPVVEWWISEFEEEAEFYESLATPVVGQLTDDDGDGDVDSDDTPDIVLLSWSSLDGSYRGVMRAISGDGSVVHWTAGEREADGELFRPLGIASAALGDVDGDGRAEIAVTVCPAEGFESRSSCHAALYDAEGQLRWVNQDEVLYCGGNAPAFADLDGDGSVELVLGHAIYDAVSGALLGSGAHGSGSYTGYANAGYHSFAIDMDGDGQQEVVAGNAVYDQSGSALCLTGYDDGYPAVADMDGDGLGEMVVTGNRSVRIFEHDCWLVDQWELPDGGYGGPATLADYDGDGEVEIGVASYDVYYVYEADGTLLWSQDTQDHSSSATGSSVYDFDGDGYAEVVYADEEDVWIYAGTDGVARMRETTHESGTVNEYPTIVDVDGDGEVEIVVADEYGVFVVGDYEHGWVAGRQVWNQASYNIVNVNDNLSIPAVPEPNWPEHNNFRSGDVAPSFGAAAPDALPILVELCTLECDQGLLRLVVQLGNAGLVEIPAGLSVAVYAGLDADDEALGVMVTTEAAVSGGSSEALVFDLDPDDLPEGALMVVVDDDGTGLGSLDECHEDNNALVITEGLCP